MAVSGEATYKATYTSAARKYLIKFVNEDGTVLQSSELAYDATPVYTGETPTKEATAQYVYTFAGWDSEITKVTGEATYTATYSSKALPQLAIFTWTEEDETLKLLPPELCSGIFSMLDELPELEDTALISGLCDPVEFPYYITPENLEGPGSLWAYAGDREGEYYEFEDDVTLEWSAETASMTIADVVAKLTESGSCVLKVHITPSDTDTYQETDADLIIYKDHVMTSYDSQGSYYELKWIGDGYEEAILHPHEKGQLCSRCGYKVATEKLSKLSLSLWEEATLSLGDLGLSEGATLAAGQDKLAELLSEYVYLQIDNDPFELNPIPFRTESVVITWADGSGDVTVNDLFTYFEQNPDSTYPVKVQVMARYYTSEYGEHEGWFGRVGHIDYRGNLDDFAPVVVTLAMKGSEIYTITWQKDDGSVIDTTKVIAGQTPTHADVTKAETEAEAYRFAGWDPAPVAAAGDATYKATFTTLPKPWIVTESGETRLDRDWVIGSTEGDPETTALASVSPAELGLIVFVGTALGADDREDVDDKVDLSWAEDYSGLLLKDIADGQEVKIQITPKAEYTDIYAPVVRTITFTVPETFTITWKDDNGDVLETDEVMPGMLPEYYGDEPTKAADAQYTYTFNGWTPEIKEATEDTVYTATYSITVNKYTIRFLNEDGTELQSSEVAYGEMPAFTGTVPTKEADDTGHYVFSWNKPITTVTGPAEYQAAFTKEAHVVPEGNGKPYGEYHAEKDPDEIWIQPAKPVCPVCNHAFTSTEPLKMELEKSTFEIWDTPDDATLGDVIDDLDPFAYIALQNIIGFEGYDFYQEGGKGYVYAVVYLKDESLAGNQFSEMCAETGACTVDVIIKVISTTYEWYLGDVDVNYVITNMDLVDPLEVSITLEYHRLG